MQLTPANTDAWAAQVSGCEKGPDGTFDGMSAADVVHDSAFFCEDCNEAFSCASDLDDGLCEACEIESRDWVGFNPLREYGTWSV